MAERQASAVPGRGELGNRADRDAADRYAADRDAAADANAAAGPCGSTARHMVFLATAESLDDEMAARISAHQAERASRTSSWSTVEEPLDLASALAALPESCGIVIDCLTLWASNTLAAGWADGTVLEHAHATAACAAARPGPVVVVSNEVGSGIVPFDPVTRRYRDLLGRVNAVYSSHANHAYLVVAGRLLELALPEQAWI
ncbi:MAG TPA: bifunctional adenosylcobinamide kinase/adenosylcobinamide-phosphate guanylyltransferase [Acidimicrobiales bacterium]|nr:bifunctional adenosylcobinamide kinase/adenosylcobinamide-phosphate guanylyltransferase [Acidimicrobiales bacterium]